MKKLSPHKCEKILVRGVNWVGDAVMTLPCIAALGEICPQAEIHVLAKPWVRAVYEASPYVFKVIDFDVNNSHKGVKGLYSLSKELKAGGYDWALLLQNAIQAALLARFANIKTRIGYDSDARGFLLNYPVKRTKAIRKIHETSYYLNILYKAGLLENAPPDRGVIPELKLAKKDRVWAENYLKEQGLTGSLLGLAPGAAFGPAKCWPGDRFAKTAEILSESGFEAIALFGSNGEKQACRQVANNIKNCKILDLSGDTTLGQALALLERLKLFITNDSGLMHAAAALDTPTVAVFGSTNPVTTSPMGNKIALVRKPVDCSPCLKKTCPKDFRCFTAISPEEVANAGLGLLA